MKLSPLLHSLISKPIFLFKPSIFSLLYKPSSLFQQLDNVVDTDLHECFLVITIEGKVREMLNKSHSVFPMLLANVVELSRGNSVVMLEVLFTELA